MQAHQKASFGTMGREAKRKLQNDNDIRIIIQGHNSATGIGKTTLAIQLCRYIDEHGWSAENKSFVNTQKYIEAHMDYQKGSALLFDEIEGAADNRRATSHENVELSQAWAKLRARNIATVCTLPTTSMLDRRMLELADYWVLVKSRGVAQPYRISVNDFAPHKLPQRDPLDGDEHITFPDLPDGDDDKRFLDNLKDEMLRSEGPEYVRQDEHKRKLDKLEKEVRKEQRDKMIRELYAETDLSTTDLADFEWVGVDQSQVSRIINNT